MRLTAEQRSAIVEETTRAFGPTASVRLFGSRVDDGGRGAAPDRRAGAAQRGPAVSDRERLGLVTAAEPWLEMRRLRHRLVHEYIERPDDLAAALQRACRFTDAMHGDYQRMREYASAHLGVEPGG